MAVTVRGKNSKLILPKVISPTNQTGLDSWRRKGKERRNSGNKWPHQAENEAKPDKLKIIMLIIIRSRMFKIEVVVDLTCIIYYTIKRISKKRELLRELSFLINE